MNATLNLPEAEENGLTASQVRACEESGQTNAVKSTTSRSILDIVRANVFTLFNGIIFAAMVLVLITAATYASTPPAGGRWRAAPEGGQTE